MSSKIIYIFRCAYVRVNSCSVRKCMHTHNEDSQNISSVSVFLFYASLFCQTKMSAFRSQHIMCVLVCI